MGRRFSTGTVGRPVIGNINIDTTVISTATADTDLTFAPEGTGRVVFDGDVQLNTQSDLRFADADDSNWVAFQAPATIAANVTWTLPSADGSSGQALVTAGNGTLSWAAAGSAIGDENQGGAEGSSNTFYPVFVSTTVASSGSMTATRVASTKLSYQPSTGTLFSRVVTGGTTSGQNLVLRSTTNATKGQVYIDETTASTTVSTGALRVGGGVGINGQLTAVTIVETSSIAFKENINPIENALDQITKLIGVTYDRKDTRVHEAGLIAEDVDKILPDLVSRDDNGNPYGIKYTKLTAYLIEAIKSLKKEIEDLKGNR